jgi:hypothetical protein
MIRLGSPDVGGWIGVEGIAATCVAGGIVETVAQG